VRIGSSFPDHGFPIEWFPYRLVPVKCLLPRLRPFILRFHDRQLEPPNDTLAKMKEKDLPKEMLDVGTLSDITEAW